MKWIQNDNQNVDGVDQVQVQTHLCLAHFELHKKVSYIFSLVW